MLGATSLSICVTISVDGGNVGPHKLQALIENATEKGAASASRRVNLSNIIRTLPKKEDGSKRLVIGSSQNLPERAR